MVSALLSKIGVPVLIAILSEVLGEVDNPAAKTASKALEKVDEALKSGGITAEQLAEANRHAERMAEIQMEDFKSALTEVNQSLRAEVASEDRYVRRMRPTFGYLMALTWAAQMFAIAYVIVFDTDKAGVVMAGAASCARLDMRRKRALRSSPTGSPVEFWNPAMEGCSA